MMKRLLNILNDDGYSFIEVFITLLIVCLISTIILLNSNTITKSINDSNLVLAEKNDFIQLRIILKEEAEEIIHPWFLKEYKVVLNSETLDIYYYHGDKNRCLTLYSGVNGVEIRDKNSIIFKSLILKGKFTFEDSLVTYADENGTIYFTLGVILA